MNQDEGMAYRMAEENQKGLYAHISGSWLRINIASITGLAKAGSASYIRVRLVRDFMLIARDWPPRNRYSYQRKRCNQANAWSKGPYMSHTPRAWQCPQMSIAVSYSIVGHRDILEESTTFIPRQRLCQVTTCLRTKQILTKSWLTACKPKPFWVLSQQKSIIRRQLTG